MYCKYCDKEHTRDECLKQGVYDLPSIQLIPFDIIGYFCPITKKTNRNRYYCKGGRLCLP